jgi:hypothetical protein
MKIGKVFTRSEILPKDKQKLQRRIRLVRAEIGRCLTELREIRQAPDNSAPARRTELKEQMGWAISQLATFKHAYPFLFNARVIQTRLELS